MGSQVDSATKPTILIVPGSFSPPSMYQSILDDLKSAGYEAIAIYLPTVGDAQKASGISLADDAAGIQAVLIKLVDEEGKDVILVTHSYGGIAGGEGAKGFAKTEREARGRKGGIVRLLYVTALIARVGESLKDTMKDCPKLDNVVVNGDHMTLDPIPNTRTLFTDLPLEEGLKWVAEMPGHSAISFDHPATYPAYKHIPMTYMLCEGDLVIPAEVQRSMVEMVEKESGRKVDVHSVPAGHVPNVTMPEAVVKTIRSAAGER
ncbi:hypothetical protein D0Z07_1839, partial [Hyphodiscus hymeniophilus]